MGKKGSWFSAIKRVFTHSSKDKAADGTDKKSSKEKKKGKRGDGHSFIPLFRKPSSIEEILGEVEREHHIRTNKPPAPPERSKIPPHVTPFVRNATLLWDDGDDDDSVRADSPPRAPSPPAREVSPPRNAVQSTAPPPVAEHSPPPPPPPRRVVPPPQAAPPARVPSPRPVRQWRPEPTLKNQHICATKIQTAYRGYMARRSFRAVRGLVRLQDVVKGPSVKRQTANALKCMQVLVRVQTQIQARRVQMLENQTPQRQSRNEKELETAFGKWLSENQANWDDSTLTKEEIEARMQKKFDAILKRERAMAYAYSHQSMKSTPRVGHGALADFRTGGYPYWWNWLEKGQPQLTPTLTPKVSKSPSMKSFLLTPTRATMDFKASPFPQSSHTGRLSLGFENMDNSTPKSTRSSIPTMSRQAKTPPGRLPPRFSRGSAASSPFNGGPFRDDDSLTSCPPFSGPRYMSPTASAQAKLKLGKEQFPDSPNSITSDASKRRASYPLGRSPGSFKWNKEITSQRNLGKNQTAQSVGNLSIDSSTSMPVSVGKKPFNRFV